MPITRHGRRDDVYWTYSYGPIDDEPAERDRRRPGRLHRNHPPCSQPALRRERARFARYSSRRPFMTILGGPDHRFEFVNPSLHAAGRRPRASRPHGHRRLPGGRRPGIYRAARSGLPHRANPTRAAGVHFACLRPGPTATSDVRYLDFVYQPMRRRRRRGERHFRRRRRRHRPDPC